MLIRKLIPLAIALFASLFIFTATQAVEIYAPQIIAKSERCPVCGMYPANYPEWHAQIVFKGGKHASFDSVAEVFRFLNNMAKFDKKHVVADIRKVYVPAYNKGRWLDAKQAFFVADSKVMGPMGKDFPAFSRKDEAAQFSQKFGGKVLNFEQITPAMVSTEIHMHDH